MEAGRELDALVAEKVMGCSVLWQDGTPVCNCDAGTHGGGYYDGGIPHYSTDIAAVWQVVEKMNSIKMDTPEGYQLRAKWSFGIHGASIYNCTAEQAAHEISLWACRAYGLLR